MNRRGKLATSIVTAIFILAMIGVITVSGPSITGAASGSQGTTAIGALITIFFVLALVSFIPVTFNKTETIQQEVQPTFKDINSRLKEIDDQLNKIV